MTAKKGQPSCRDAARCSAVRLQYSCFIDKRRLEYKGDWNTVFDDTRLSTTADTTTQTINADSPYSLVGLDPCDEPFVITMPQIEKARHYGCSLFDLWGCFDMLGTRATGNDAASNLVYGPGWKGDAPQGIRQAFRMETALGTAALCTQLSSSAGLDNVREVQAGYKVPMLAQCLGQPVPCARFETRAAAASSRPTSR